MTGNNLKIDANKLNLGKNKFSQHVKNFKINL